VKAITSSSASQGRGSMVDIEGTAVVWARNGSGLGIDGNVLEYSPKTKGGK